MTSVMIVVPCYDEASRLDPSRFREFADATPGVRFLFVDDGSTDGTGEILQGLHESDPRAFSVLRLPSNRGKGEAVRSGLLQAFDSGATYVGFWDADLATPLGALPAFTSLLDERPELDIVMGSRVRLLGRRIERRAARHYTGRVFATLVSWLLNAPVYDTQCGAKLFRGTPEMRALFMEPFITRWLFDVEILARFGGMRGRRIEDGVYELPLTEWRDVAGSKVALRDFATALVDLVSIYSKYMRPARGLTEHGASSIMEE